jgi:cell division protein FtsA
MDFVSYHLKQAGLDNRNLNGGIILTGGGSQLKHLLQLTEYQTGLNARIGFPNEHLGGDHSEELAMPMYSTCIGLILKGYNDFENKNRQMADNFIKISELEGADIDEVATAEEIAAMEAQGVPVTKRKTLKEFMDSFKNNILEMFKEEGDTGF